MDAGARFQAAADVHWRDGPGELLLFDARADEYYVLNEAAAQIWRRLVAGVQVKTIAAEMATQFEIDPATILADVIEAASDLGARGLLDNLQVE